MANMHRTAWIRICHRQIELITGGRIGFECMLPPGKYEFRLPIVRSAHEYITL